MKSIIFIFLIGVSLSANAFNISVGGVSIEIPAPQGYAAITPQLSDLYEYRQFFVPPKNKEFVAFASIEDIRLELLELNPSLTRTFYVQTMRSIVSYHASKSDFQRAAGSVKDTNNNVVRNLGFDTDNIIKQMNNGLMTKYDADAALEFSSFIPFEPHNETDTTLSYSALAKYYINDERGNSTAYVGSGTISLLLIKNRVLILGVIGASDDLEWTRTAAKIWISSIVSAN